MTESAEQPVDWAEPKPNRRWPRLGAVVAVLALLGLAAWYLIDMRGGSSDETASASAEPVALSADGLKTLAGSLGQPVYWLGEQPNTTYEVMQSPDGRVYVRYLPAGTEAGDPRAFTTVGTYAVRNAYEIIDSRTREPGASAISVSGGGVGLVTKTSPTNVYVAYPGSDYQIEIFSPVRNQARELVESGALQAVGGPLAPGTTSGAAGVSASRLKALAASLGQPIYWAGARPKTTYEFTRVPNGNIFVRYLPTGTPVGTSRPHLTVSTYPFVGAFKATKEAASKSGAVEIPVAGGAIAFYGQKKPTNVYVAFPGSGYQIEIFSPVRNQARELVAAGRITPVR